MDLDVIENDPTEVKKYLQNFVPINYYRVLGDEYLYQVRASLLHSASGSGYFSARYEGMLNDITISVGDNTARIVSQQEAWADLFSAGAKRTDILEAKTASANAAIEEIREVTASTNAAQATINKTLQTSLNDMIVGGRNLIVNSTFEKGYEAWGAVDVIPSDHYIGKMHRMNNTGGPTFGISALDEFKKIRLVQGNQYSLSFYGFGSILLLDEVYLESSDGTLTKLPNITMSTDLTERRHITFTAPIGGDGIGFVLGASSDSSEDWFSVAQLKLELGNKPTDWTPAPEDVDGYISEVQSSINEFRDAQVTRNEATATAIDTLDSRVGDNTSQIINERKTNATKFKTLTQTTDILAGKTGDNAARIEQVNTVITGKYETVAERVNTLEADSSLGKGKITELENVTANNAKVIVSTNTELSAKIDGIAIGGRNLLRNADFKLGYKLWGTAAVTDNENILGNLITVTNVGDETTYFGVEPDDRYQTIKLVAGHSYVLSFYAEGSIAELNDIWVRGIGVGELKLPNVPVTTSLGLRSELVFTPTFSTEEGSIIIGANGYPTNEWFGVVAVKLEQGTKATDWTAAPEDTRELINSVEANINEFKVVQVERNLATASAIETMDSSIGTNTSNITNNYNTLVSADEATTKKLNSLSAAYEANKTKVTSAIKIVADANEVTTSQLETLETEYGENKIAVESSLETLTTKNVALTTSVNNLTSKVGTNETNLTNEIETRTTQYESVTKRLTATEGKSDNAIARISAAESTIASNTQSIAETKDELVAEFNNLEIGGRNYTRNFNSWNTYSGASALVSRDGNTVILSKTTSSDNASYASNHFTRQGKIAFSVNVRTSGITRIYIVGRGSYISTSHPDLEISTAGFELPSGFDERITIYQDFADELTGNCYFGVYGDSPTAGAEFSYPQFEKGTKSTDWKPAIEDTDAAISTNSASIADESKTRADEDEALSKRITTAQSKADSAFSKVTTAEKTLANNTGAITELSTDVVASYKSASAGKNLFVQQGVADNVGYIIPNTGEVGESTVHRYSNYIPVVGGTKYTIHTRSGNLHYLRIAAYDANKKYINGAGLYSSGAPSVTSKGWVTPTNAAFIRISSDINNGDDIDKWKVEVENVTNYSMSDVDSNAVINSLTTSTANNTRAISQTRTELTANYKSYTDSKTKALSVGTDAIKLLNPAQYSTNSSTNYGYLIIETPIAPSRMTRVEIEGYNYRDKATTVKLDVGFYNTTSGFHRYDFTSTGSFEITKVQVARHSSSLKAVIIIGLDNTLWNYPKLVVSSALIGYNGSDESLANGWSMRIGTDITGYVELTNIPGTHVQKELSDNRAAITQESKARADALGAMASTMTKLEATTRANTALYYYDMNSDYRNWTNHSGDGNIFASTAGVGIGNNSGNDQAWLIRDENIAAKKGVIYKITCRYWNRYGGGTTYVGVAGIAADGVTFVNTTGSNSTGGQHYVGSNKYTGWRELTGYIARSGTDISGLTNARNLHSDAVNFRPLVIVNYSGQAGITYIEYFKIEVVDRAATAFIEETREVVAGVSAKWSLKLSVNGYISGMEQYNTGLAAGFNVIADEFKIVNSGGWGQYPFRTDGNYVYINNAVIENGSITNAKIANLAVNSSKIGNLAVNSSKIGDLAVSTAKIANGAITTAKIGLLQVDFARIKNGAVDTLKIADGAIETAKIGDLAVNTLKIADHAVTVPRLFYYDQFTEVVIRYGSSFDTFEQHIMSVSLGGDEGTVGVRVHIGNMNGRFSSTDGGRVEDVHLEARVGTQVIFSRLIIKLLTKTFDVDYVSLPEAIINNVTSPRTLSFHIVCRARGYADFRLEKTSVAITGVKK